MPLLALNTESNIGSVVHKVNCYDKYLEYTNKNYRDNDMPLLALNTESNL